MIMMAVLTIYSIVFRSQMHARKSLRQLMWEGSQFYPSLRDGCVSDAFQQQLMGRGKMSRCQDKIARRLNTFNHLHFIVTVAEKDQQQVKMIMIVLLSILIDYDFFY